MYQRELDRILEQLEASGERPSLLLHVCCAPCSSYVLEYLTPYFAITLDYYNPNISPEAECDKRVAELRRLLREMPRGREVSLVAADYDHGAFLASVSGLESEPEGGARCERCFELRLREAAERAAAGGFDYYTTTLSISPLKDARLLNEIGEREGKRAGVRYLPSDFKKRGGYQRSIELSKTYDLYRQDYCGCEYSRAERAMRKRGRD